VITGPFTARAALSPLRRLSEKATKSERNSEIREGNRAIVSCKLVIYNISTELVILQTRCLRESEVERERRSVSVFDLDVETWCIEKFRTTHFSAWEERERLYIGRGVRESLDETETRQGANAN